MIRLLRRPLGWLLLLCLAPVLLIRAQPYVDHEWRALLLPSEQCPAPCFMGIRPGVMTAAEALVILENNAWVGQVVEDFGHMKPEVIDFQLPPMLSLVMWQWAKVESRWIDTGKSGSLSVFDRQVVAINVPTRLPLGAVLLTYGAPDAQRLVWAGDSYHTRAFQYDAWYTQPCMRILTSGAGSWRSLYWASVQVSFQRRNPGVYDVAVDDSLCDRSMG
jgi:hypothetical protein